MLYMEPSFVSEDLIWPKANRLLLTAFLLLSTILYFMHMRITPSEPHAYSAVQLAGYSYGLS